ncbi:TPA: hypothetical protein ACGD48_002083 [Serratia marcescens]
MSVPNQTPYNIYTANGLTNVFPYEFYLLAVSDLAVSINGEVLTTGYSVSGVGNVDGGEVTFFTPPSNGATVLLQREIPSTRLTDYQDSGDLLADTVNKDFDRLWMAIRQAYLYLGFALTRPIWGGPFNAKGYRIENLGYPVNSTDAASKQYVDDAGAANLGKTLRFPESYVPPMTDADVRSNMLQGYNDLGYPVPIAGQTETADLAIKLAGSGGSQLIGHTDLISKFYRLDDYLDQGYILVSSRDELLAAQNVIKTVLMKRTEIRLSRNFAPWTAAQTDIDLDWVTITGHANGTYIDATGIPNVDGNYFIRFYNSGSQNINGLPFLEGLRFSGVSVKGPGRNSLVDGILFHSPEVSLGNVTVGYFNIQEFKRGLVFQTNAYIIKVMNAYIARCNTAGVDQPFGFSNYGENIAFYGCTIGVSGGPAVHINNGNGGFHLHNCSLDYTGQVIVTEAGYVEVHGGHHEFDNGVNPLTNIPYVVTNAQTARIALIGTKMVCIRSAGMTQPYLVRAETAADGVYMFGVQMQNILTTSGDLKTGNGRFVIRDTQVQDGAGNHRLTVPQSQFEARMIDGGNEAELPLDWFVRRVNSSVISRTQGDNIVLTNSTDIARTGVKSLKVTKSTAGKNHGIAVISPVTFSSQPTYRFYVYPIAGTTGSVFTESYFVAVQGYDQYGRPNIVKQSASMGIRTTLLTGSSTWQSVISYPSKTPVPSWATHIFVEVNSSGLGVGGYYIDDAGVWQI